MTKRSYKINLERYHKLIVGEGESDRNFFSEFCVSNVIEGFDYAFAGMHDLETYSPSGFDNFEKLLVILPRVPHFDVLTDVVLVCDSTDNAAGRVSGLRRQIHEANAALGSAVYDKNFVVNEVSNSGSPRLHVLTIPAGAAGGLESLCVNVARDHLNNDGKNKGTQIEGWVNEFANKACDGWTTEKRDKLRLQAFISAAWKKKPDMHFSQLFDITREHPLVPLDGGAFEEVRVFLRAVSQL